jgi:hypothetical protein
MLIKLIPFLSFIFFILQISNIFTRTAAFCESTTIHEKQELPFGLLEFFQSCNFEYEISILLFLNYWFFASLCVIVSLSRKTLFNEYFSKVILKNIKKDSILKVLIYYIPIMTLSICHKLLKDQKRFNFYPYLSWINYVCIDSALAILSFTFSNVSVLWPSSFVGFKFFALLSTRAKI